MPERSPEPTRQFTVPVPQFYALFVVVTLYASGMMLSVNRGMSAPTALIWCAIAGFVVLASFGRPPAETWGDRLRRLPTPSLVGIGLGLLVCAPAALYLALTLDQEFAYSGDNDYHYGSFYGLPALGPWTGPVPRLVFVASMLAVLAALLRAAPQAWQRWGRWLLPLVFAVFFAHSIVLAKYFGVTILARYPNLSYVLSIPTLAVENAIELLGGDPPLALARRLSNTLAVPAWLFALRPFIIGKWPDLRTLPVGLFLFFEPSVIYYATSQYLEIWGMVLALLAAEVLIEKGDDSAPTACLLVGLAAMFKEPFFFLLPFVWLAGRPWRGPWSRRIAMIGAGVAAALPFMLYLTFRRARGIWRTVEPDAGRLLDADNWHQFFHRLTLDYGLLGSLVVLATLMLLLASCLLARDRRWQFTCLAAGALFAFLVFFIDESTGGYIGIFRFNLPVLPFIAAAFWSPLLLTRPAANLPLVSAGLVLLGLAQPLTAAMVRAAAPDAERNFIEHYDAAIFLPIRQLLSAAEKAGALASVSKIVANQPDITAVPIDGLSYRRPVEFDAKSGLACECRRDDQGVMALFVPTTNLFRSLGQGFPGEGRSFAWLTPSPRFDYLNEDRYRHWRGELARAPACMASLRKSCRLIFSAEVRGLPWGILGIGVSK